jgi:hypothetical protein
VGEEVVLRKEIVMMGAGAAVQYDDRGSRSDPPSEQVDAVRVHEHRGLGVGRRR